MGVYSLEAPVLWEKFQVIWSCGCRCLLGSGSSIRMRLDWIMKGLGALVEWFLTPPCWMRESLPWLVQTLEALVMLAQPLKLW